MKRTAFKRKTPPPRPATQYTGTGPKPRTPASNTTMAGFVQPMPKRRYQRDEDYRRWVASLRCAHCYIAGFSQAAHSDAGADGKGKGIKADDGTCFPACADRPLTVGCHTLMGATGHYSRELQQALCQKYVKETKILAQLAGKWPVGWT